MIVKKINVDAKMVLVRLERLAQFRMEINVHVVSQATILLIPHVFLINTDVITDCLRQTRTARNIPKSIAYHVIPSFTFIILNQAPFVLQIGVYVPMVYQCLTMSAIFMVKTSAKDVIPDSG